MYIELDPTIRRRRKFDFLQVSGFRSAFMNFSGVINSWWPGGAAIQRQQEQETQSRTNV